MVAAVATAVAAAVLGLPPGVAAAATSQLSVDLSKQTGDVLRGATGTLYGFADAGGTGAAVAAGQAPRTTAQKPQGGCQHSNGDILDVAQAAKTAGSQQLIVYMQDIYCNFPYEQPGIDDYAAKVQTMVQQVAARPDRDMFAWVPFNEPDQIWYSDWSDAGKQRFFADWKRIVTEIRSIIPGALIIGPNEANYNPGRIADILTYAKANNVLPDITSWHELNPGSLANYRGHYADYRQIEKNVGITPRVINIDEYANNRDLSVPGQLVQWISMFEDTKVDADLAYWTYSGTLDDNVAQTTHGNSGWWLMKWYADLTGKTVTVTPPQPNTTDTLQGLGTVDVARKQATVLFGGTADATNVAVSGIDTSVFGNQVSVEVSRTAWAGYEAANTSPPVISRQTRTVTNGAVTVSVPAGSPMNAYRLVVTPLEKDTPLTAPWTASYEAENAQLQNAAAALQNRPNPGYNEAQVYAQSGSSDVGGISKADSAVTFSTNVPAQGTYTLGVVYGTNQVPQQQALWIDGAFVRVLPYSATFSWLYKGRLDVPVTLGAGAHTISLRTAGPQGQLPSSDVTLDRIDLTQVSGPEKAHYGARDARLTGSATITAGTSTVPAAARVASGGSARFFVSAAEDGYYDIATRFTTTGAAGLAVSLNGRAVATPAGSGAGKWVGTSRVHLGKGISEFTVTGSGSGSVGVTAVDVTRATAGDASTQKIEAESATLAGRPGVITDGLASGGAYVGYTGTENGQTGTVTVPRGPATGAGAYDLTLSYGNNARAGVRTEGVSRSLTATETGGSGSGQPASYRNNYAWNNFWSLTTPLTLTTSGGAVVLGNPSAAGPNLDTISLSKLVLSSTVAAG